MTFLPSPGEEEACQNEVRAAVADIVARYGGLLGHFVLIGEVAEINDENDTDTGLWSTTSKNAKTWHVLGMLESAKMIEQAQFVNGEVE